MTQQQATDGMGKMELGIKRTADILFAMVGMVVLSPVMLAVALSIRLQQNGPIFFRQVRIGKGGKPFVILSGFCAAIISTNCHSCGMCSEATCRW